jgi:hypothetical protein
MTENKEWHIEGGDGWNIFEGKRIVANCGGYSSNFEDTTEWKKTNAKLIETAVNSCKSINKDNPQIVAESVEEMYELTKFADNISGITYGGNIEISPRDYYKLKELSGGLLNKLEGK